MDYLSRLGRFLLPQAEYGMGRSEILNNALRYRR